MLAFEYKKLLTECVTGFLIKKTREIHSYEMRQAEKMYVQIFEDCSS